VLIDSERLAVKVAIEGLAELGWSLGEGEAIERFKGRSAEQEGAELEAQPGCTLPGTLALCDARFGGCANPSCVRWTGCWRPICPAS
jgi:hypothetical protein